MGMNAINRTLPQWFSQVDMGLLALPRFQRYESWSHAEVVTLLDSVLRGRPVGAVLVLQIGDKEPFVSRPMAGAPQLASHVPEHLLDGQQRLTALWKALNDRYEDRTYFAVLRPQADDAPRASSVSRWNKNGQRYPLWADWPKEQLSRGLVPMKLLSPTVQLDEIAQWCRNATDSVEEASDVLIKVAPLQSAAASANLPYLSLPVNTPAHEAIDVFVKMNTTSVAAHGVRHSRGSI